MNPYIADMLKHDEGTRLKPYKDSVGKLTIGVGRNLDDVGISQAECNVLLAHDIQHVEAQAVDNFPWFEDLDPVRQAVVLSMLFNLGLAGFRGFANTIQSIAAGNYNDAAERMLVSKWATQVKGRADRLAEQMRTGVLQYAVDQ